MYHVTLNGQGYLVDLSKYVRRSAAPFAPKRAQGDRTYGDFAHDQGLRISDWSGGEGYLQLDPDRPERWRAGSGVDVYTEPGSLRLGPHAANTIELGIVEVTAAIAWGGFLYTGWSNGDVWKWDGTAVSLAFSVGASKPVRCLVVFGPKLYAGNGTDGQVTSWDGAAASVAFTVPNCWGVLSLRTFYRQTAQYLYVGAVPSSALGRGSVYWWDGATLSAKQYDFEQREPWVALVLGNRLYWFVSRSGDRRLGIYSVDDAGSGGVYRAHGFVDGLWASAGAVLGGVAYVGMGNDGGIYRWDGSRLEVVRHLGTAAAPYGVELRSMATWNGALWVGIVEGGAISLLRSDGTSWSRPVAGVAGLEPRAMAVYGGLLHVGSRQGVNGRVYRVTAAFGASGALESGLFDAGLPSVDKVLRSVTVVHAPLAVGQSVQIQYRLEEAGGWLILGTSNVVGTTSATFSFGGTVRCKQVALRIVLGGTAGASSSPIIYDVLLRYAPAPELKRAWELAVLLEGTAELPLVRLNGTPEPLTGAQLSAALWTAGAATGPVTFVDLDGVGRSVWVEDIREEVAPLSQRTGYQTVGRVRLLEA